MVVSSSNNDNQEEAKNQALDLFKAIFGQTDGFMEVRAFPSDRDKPIQSFFCIPGELDKAAAFATKLKSQVFFGVAPRARQGGKAEDVAALATLWIDGDADKGALSWTILPVTPIAVVDSGNPSGKNYHAYYALDIPFELKTESDREKAVTYLKALSTVLKARVCKQGKVLGRPQGSKDKVKRGR